VEAILSVHVVRVQLDLDGLPDHPVHESGIGGERAGVLELDSMYQVDTVFGHGRFIWMLQTVCRWYSLTLVSTERPVCPM
jgi:hypothetical protein